MAQKLGLGNWYFVSLVDLGQSGFYIFEEDIRHGQLGDVICLFGSNFLRRKRICKLSFLDHRVIPQ